MATYMTGPGTRSLGVYVVARRKSRSKGKNSSSQKRGRSSSSRRKTWKLDYDEIIPQIGREVIERLGLDYIGVDIDFIRDILEEIVAGIAESRSTKPSIESLINNIIRNKRMFYKAVAAKLILKENLTVEQLEFILDKAPELAGRAAPRLYRIAKDLGADHVIDGLRALWFQYGKPTPFTCPRCGFMALTPELVCMVCGEEVSEEEFKESIRFRELLKTLVEESPSSAYEILSAGFVLYDGVRLGPPRSRALLSGTPLIGLYSYSGEKRLVAEIASRRISG